MEDTGRSGLNRLELETQEYSVYITDEKGTSSGSGLLYYPGVGDRLFVFTCAHVIEELREPFQIYYFVPVDREKEDYRVVRLDAMHGQVVYSPLDVVTRENGTRRHSVDAAVICLVKDEGTMLDATDYFIGEAHKSDAIFIQGFPGEWVQGMEMLEHLDCAHGMVLHNVPDKDTVLCRVEDTFLDHGNRVGELIGFSGSPVWNGTNGEKSILGLFACGIGETIYRGKVNAIKMEVVRSIMKNHFQIRMRTHILGIPEEDIAPVKEEMAYVEEKKVDVKNIYDDWLAIRTEKVRAYIDDVKFQSAIDTAKEAMRDARFSCCSKENVMNHMKHLLYCYEVCYLFDEYHALEEEMREKGLLEGHDTLRWITLNFGNRNFKEAEAYAKKVLEETDESEQIYTIARVYASLCRAYEENAGAEETIGQFLDERECLKLECTDTDTKALIYQMIGYVYGERYHEHIKSVRCLNRAYRLGTDYAVLETLGCAYYFLALEHALREDNTVDMLKIDRAALYKARESFLILLDKADELYLSAMMKREGGVIFNIFYFQQDNYRILTLYPYLMANLMTDDAKEERDFERKYGRTVCQSGNIDLSEFHYLEEEDKILLTTLASEHRMLHELDVVVRGFPDNTLQQERGLCDVIAWTERNLPEIDEKERISVVTLLLNLYGQGRQLFGWNVASQMEKHMEVIRANGDREMVITFENFLYENTHSEEEAEQKFIESWRENPSFHTWQEVLQFYKRNGMLDKADQMFESLFRDHVEYVEAEPEYAYRAYIMYILDYRRDIKHALQFYITHKADMKDENIRDFWEHELMFCTNCFNNPEEFEEERRLFVEQGLLPKEEFHRTVLIAYMCNLDSEHAWEHFSKENPYFGIFGLTPNAVPYLTREGAQFLIWQRKFPPHMETDWNGMNPQKANAVFRQFEQEEWHVSEERIAKRLEIEIQRTIAIDAWGLYLLAFSERLDCLESYDCIYVTHLSVSRMLEEMTHYKNEYLESVIAYLEATEAVRLQSPGFEAQLAVRERADYFEPCSTIAMAVEASVPAIIGEPMLDEAMVEEFKNYIVRPDCVEKLLRTLRN